MMASVMPINGHAARLCTKGKLGVRSMFGLRARQQRRVQRQGRHRALTVLRDSRTAPLASVLVTIIGSISGVRPTATDSATRKASSQSPLVKPLTKKMIGNITAAKRISSQLTLLTPAWNALGAVSVAVACAASVPR